MNELKVVALSGAGGGFLGWLFGLTIGRTLNVGPSWLGLPIGTALGAGAAIMFVFLIANTDRTDRPRLIALALLGGFFWGPVFEAATMLIQHKQDSIRASEAQAATERALALVKQINQAKPDERAELAEELTLEMTRIGEIAGTVEFADNRAMVAPATTLLLEALEKLPADEQLQLLTRWHQSGTAWLPESASGVDWLAERWPGKDVLAPPEKTQ